MKVSSLFIIISFYPFKDLTTYSLHVVKSYNLLSLARVKSYKQLISNILKRHFLGS